MKLQNGILKRTIVFIDVETKPKEITKKINENKLTYGFAKLCEYYSDGCRITKDEIEFTTEETFWIWLFKIFKQQPNLILIAHNCVFDLQVLHFETWLDHFGFVALSPYHAATTTIYKLVKDNYHLTILDNMNWFPMPLKALGKAIGLEKLEVDFSKVSKKYLAKYCQNDVEIMIKAQDMLNQFVLSEKGSEWRQTLPAISFRLWFNSYRPTGYYTKRPKEIALIERESYHGGRVEVFRQKSTQKEMIYKLDVNSMYPYVMSEYKFPSRFIGASDSVTVSNLRKALTKYCAVAEVEIETDKPAFPVVVDKHLVFPTGKFTTYLCAPELDYALENQMIKSVIRCNWYYADDLFIDFISHFYELRKNAKRDNNTGFNVFYKLIMNSLYGKFGQQEIKYEVESVDPENDKPIDYVISNDKNILQSLAYFDHKRYRLVQNGDSALSFCAVASHVTSAARIYLWTLIEKAGIDNVYYCDTDSLFVNRKGKNNLQEYLDDEELGFLKIEGESKNAEFFVPKDYIFSQTTKRKGIRQNATTDDGISFRQENFLSPSGRRIKKLDEGNYTVQIEKRLNRHYAVKFRNKANIFVSPVLPNDLERLKANFKIPKEENKQC